jgi:proline iminopeptidase
VVSPVGRYRIAPRRGGKPAAIFRGEVRILTTPMNSTGSDSPQREGFVAVPGGSVWYRIVGADRPGVPLLVLHGGPGATHDYLETLAVLADERPVIFYDQLGAGNSPAPADASLWTVARFSAELTELRRALHLDRVHLLGQSWGTMLAVDHALAGKAGSLASLVLSGPFLSGPRFIADQRAWLAQMPMLEQRIIAEREANGRFDAPEYQEAMMTYYRRHVCRLDPWPDCLNRTFAKMSVPLYRHMWGPSEFTATGTLRDADYTGRLREIRCPALFTCGRYDECTPAASAHYQSLLPGAYLKVFESASHEHHLEQPEHYFQVVRAFLRTADGPVPKSS